MSDDPLTIIKVVSLKKKNNKTRIKYNKFVYNSRWIRMENPVFLTEPFDPNLTTALAPFLEKSVSYLPETEVPHR